MAGLIVMTIAIILMNILSHFFEAPESIILKRLQQIEITNQKILLSNEEIIKLIKEKL